MAVVLALLCAFAWGVSDFVGGLWSRRHGPWTIAFAGQVGALLAATLAAVFVWHPIPRADALWSVLGGLGAGAGTAMLYRGLSRGSMGTVAPMSAVTAAVVPLTVGAAMGERPGPWAVVGISLALPAIWMISSGPGSGRRGGIADGLWSGLGFGVYFVALAQIDPRSGLPPLAVVQAVAFVPIILLARTMGEPVTPRSRSAWMGFWIGPVVAVANLAFLWAADLGQLVVVSVLASLYPAVTVALAAVVLRERIRRWQAAGLGIAALSVALISLS